MHVLTPRISVTLACCALVAVSGCHDRTKPSKANFKTALGNYYNAHPECVWGSPVKFPAQMEPADGQNPQYAALFDAGLLTRTTEQKKVFFFSTKTINVYDISSRGRSLWSPNAAEPGYGNFCFGHRDVTSIDNYTSSSDKDGNPIANVDYHWSLSGLADWAKSSEVQTAFPIIQSDVSGSKVAQATLASTDKGWQVTQP